MARIRSIHPGLFTDEAFMSASAHARLLIIGLWCEAFDDGCFEIKPLTIKARIFPADNVDMCALLSELEGLDYFRRFSARGKDWAAIRNFRRFQRPKKPNTSGVLPDDLSSYVGMDSPSSDDEGNGSPPVSNQYGTGSVKPPQMEDGGGRREEVVQSSLRSDCAAPPLIEPDILPPEPEDPDAALFRRGREVLGSKAGALIAKLKRAGNGDIQTARRAIEKAAGRDNPVEYIGAVLRRATGPPQKIDHMSAAFDTLRDQLRDLSH